MPAIDIVNAGRRLVVGGSLSFDNAHELLQTAAGTHVSREEFDAARQVVSNAGMDSRTREYVASTLRTMNGLLAQKDRQNQLVKAEAPQLQAEEQARLAAGVATTSFAGTTLPDAVKDLVRGALAAGATAYDVRELDDPGFDEAHGGWSAAGVWTPYPQEAQPVGTMSFEHTEITPKKIADDMATPQTFYKLVGEEQVAAGSRTITVPKYERVTEKGSGNITTRYDEIGHPRPDARGPDGAIWASNYAILSDGSLHAVPAMRRYQAQPGLILTNPSLARGERMLANGHLEMVGGVVQSIGVSGRLVNRVMKDGAKLVDPLAVLKAWGFQLAPNLELQFEGGGTPAIDANTHLIQKP